ncbi:HTR-like protein [Natronomonas sp. F2-12]|jgi:KaiC/GvpD/RAD55 family RecA-like ATPase|uniref:HTR-like protein n=1 Tax=Natronomonas aquatica TaxID=2841590 RepID=A0A9R1CT49_9EURY|nr:HTR-like protein [Natronomonas aquatica]MCQ4333171.1 HTR-like protein [Natronomonas aquatica]
MDRIPFGIRRLDTTIGGGAPPGSVVLLSGEAGAGAREFMYTAALMNGLTEADPDLFDLYYGDLDEATAVPEAVHYISFTARKEQLRDEMALTMDESIVDAAVESVTFHDLSAEYFHLSPVPREWYSERVGSISDLGDTTEQRSLPRALGDRLTENAVNTLVVIDSLTDLVGAPMDDLSWDDVPVLLRGITRAASEWGGLVLVYVSRGAIDARHHGQLVDAADGTLVFEWESGGSTRDRTMVVKQFGGVLSRIEAEDIVQFETEIGDSGFDISDVRKIR